MVDKYNNSEDFDFSGPEAYIEAYINDGYDSEQIAAIQRALKKNINIQPYLNTAYHGSCINEIAIGLEHNIDVTPFAHVEYTWRKMREIRLGIEHHIDISQYLNPMYSYWQMREIRLGLEEGLDVNSYKSLMYTAKEMKKRRLELKHPKTATTLLGSPTVINDKDYTLQISPDGLSARLSWNCKRPVNIQELEFILYKNGIVYGIDYNALMYIAKKYGSTDTIPIDHEDILIAKGTDAVNGADGYYEWFFNTNLNRLPDLSNNGVPQFDSVSWFEPVEEGQVLAVYHSASLAADGKTVTGETIHAKTGKNRRKLTGTGFKLLTDSDSQTYVSAKNGHVRLFKNKLIVSDLAVCEELQPLSSPVAFDCDVRIKGNISGPVTLNVNGDLEIDGFVEGAQINCSGSLLLKRGINMSSNPNPVTVKGKVVSKFFEYVTLHADGNIYFGTSLNSNISSYGEIIAYGEKGGIIGGFSYSEKGYCIPNLGNPAAIQTTLLLGTNINIRCQRFELENEAATIRSTIARLNEAYNTFCKKLTINQRSSNDMFLKTEQAIHEKKAELEAVMNKMSALDERLARACRSKIIVEHQVYENVHIRYMDKKITAIPSKHIAISVNNNRLTIEKLPFYETKSA